MALTTLTPITPHATPGEYKVFGAEPNAATDGFVAATADIEFVNDGKTLLFVRNSDSSGTDIGFTFPAASIGGVPYAASGAGGTVPAGKCGIFGPFPTKLNNGSSKIVGTVSNLTSVRIAALKVDN